MTKEELKEAIREAEQERAQKESEQLRAKLLADDAAEKLKLKGMTILGIIGTIIAIVCAWHDGFTFEQTLLSIVAVWLFAIFVFSTGDKK